MEIFNAVLFFKELYQIFIHLWQNLVNGMPLKPMCTGVVPFLGHYWFCQIYHFLHALHTCQEFCLKQNQPVFVFFFLLFPWQAFPKFLMISVDPVLMVLIYSFLPFFLRKDLSFSTTWIITERMTVL